MSRKKLAYLILFAAAALSIIVLLINREKKLEEKLQEKKLRHVSFLDVDPKWADSVLSKMSMPEKIAQLFVVELSVNLVDSAVISAEIPKPGGFIFSDINAEEMTKMAEKIRQEEKIPFFMGAADPSYFYKKSAVSDSAMITYINEDSLINEFLHYVSLSGKQNGLNFFSEPFITALKSDPGIFAAGFHYGNKKYARLATLFSRQNASHHLLSSAYIPFEIKDSLKSKTTTSYLQALVDSGVAVLETDPRWMSDATQKTDVGYYLTSKLKFKGIILASADEKKDIKPQLEKMFESGAGLIKVKNFVEAFTAFSQLVEAKEIDKQLIDERVKKILLAKSWVQVKREDTLSFRPVHPRHEVMEKLLTEASVCVLKNDNKILPLKRVNGKKTLFASAGSPLYDNSLATHVKSMGMEIRTTNFKDLSSLVSNKAFSGSSLVIVSIDNYLLKESDKKSIEELKKLQSSKNIVVVNYSNRKNLDYLEGFKTVVFSPSHKGMAHTAVTEQLFGNEKSSGKLPAIISSFKAGAGIATKKTRLSFVKPEELGFDSDSLLSIDYIMNEGIRNRAFPGGVVLFAKDGKIFYHKAYGHHTYEAKVATKTDHLFDIASMTKTCATTVMAMHLYEKKKYGLDDSLYKHLPDTLRDHHIYNSTLENITFRELLVHGSGLPAGHNIIRYLRFDEDFGKFDLYFCDEPNEDYSVRVAENFYIEKCCVDTLWYDLNRLGTSGTKDYLYSDANMNVLFTFLRSKIDNKWDRYLDSLFYAPLGMKRTCFNPREKEFEVDEIVPTEDDKYWRGQLLQGYVHDPTAALYGGVAGNAGLFSTAYDLAILAQLWLNKGEYAGERYFNNATIDLFTSSQPGTHRGLGFNKQISGNTYGCSPHASDKTYGHTGFTGTAIWIDPETQIIYIFLTNRVHPVSDNKKIIELGTTKRVHSVVYELMMNKVKKETEM
ncbi:MAG: serine hydrolase [Bacteroidota bacterium]